MANCRCVGRRRECCSTSRSPRLRSVRLQPAPHAARILSKGLICRLIPLSYERVRQSRNRFVMFTRGPPKKSNLACRADTSNQITHPGGTRDWLRSKNPACEAVKQEAEEDWGR